MEEANLDCGVRASVPSLQIKGKGFVCNWGILVTEILEKLLSVKAFCAVLVQKSSDYMLVLEGLTARGPGHNLVVCWSVLLSKPDKN